MFLTRIYLPEQLITFGIRVFRYHWTFLSVLEWNLYFDPFLKNVFCSSIQVFFPSTFRFIFIIHSNFNFEHFCRLFFVSFSRCFFFFYHFDRNLFRSLSPISFSKLALSATKNKKNIFVCLFFNQTFLRLFSFIIASSFHAKFKLASARMREPKLLIFSSSPFNLKLSIVFAYNLHYSRSVPPFDIGLGQWNFRSCYTSAFILIAVAIKVTFMEKCERIVYSSYRGVRVLRRGNLFMWCTAHKIRVIQEQIKSKEVHTYINSCAHLLVALPIDT